MVVEGFAERLADHRGADDAAPDGREPPAAPAQLARRLAPSALFLLYSPKYLFLLPGVLMMVVGVVGGIRSSPPADHGWWSQVRREHDALLRRRDDPRLPACSWTFAEIFAMGEGLRPPDPNLVAAFDYITLELGLAIGSAMFLAGLVGGIVSVADWGSRGFGDLEATRTLRLVIPSVTLMILGAQGIMSSFFLSVLGLRRR